VKISMLPIAAVLASCHAGVVCEVCGFPDGTSARFDIYSLQPFAAVFTPMNHDKNWADPYSPYGRFDENYIRFKTSTGLDFVAAVHQTQLITRNFQNGKTIPIGDLLPFLQRRW
jgi:hypothetical protein